MLPPLDMKPITQPRRSGGIPRAPTARAIGCMTASPSPMTKRSAMSAGSEGATAQRAEATPNVARPTSSSRRRPNRSANRPTSGITNASASRLTVTVHWAA